MMLQTRLDSPLSETYATIALSHDLMQGQMVRTVDLVFLELQIELDSLKMSSVPSVPMKRALPAFSEWPSCQAKGGADEKMIGFYKFRSRNGRQAATVPGLGTLA